MDTIRPPEGGGSQSPRMDAPPERYKTQSSYLSIACFSRPQRGRSWRRIAEEFMTSEAL